MQVSVEVVAGLERRMTVELPTADIEVEVTQRLQKAAKDVRIDGFRKGKVPMKTLQQRFGPSVRQEVLGDLVNKSYSKAIAQEEVRPAGAPTIEPLSENLDGDTFSYAAVFEVYPDVVVADLSQIEVKKAVAEVTDADLLDMLEKLRTQHADWNDVQREAKDGDKANIDFVGTVDGEEFEGGSAQGTDLELGSGSMIPGFEQGILGMQIADVRNVEVTFPEDYQAEELKGKEAVFAITLNSLQEKSLPEINEDFAIKLGVADGDLDKFKAEVRTNMDRELESRSQSYVKNQVMKALGDIHDIGLPSAMVKEEIGRVKGEMFQQYGENANLDLSQFPDEPFVEQAETRVKLGLVLSEIVAKHDISVEMTKVKEEIALMASGYEQPEQVEQYYLSNEQALNTVRMKVLEDQVVEHVVDQAKVTEATMSYEELMQES